MPYINQIMFPVLKVNTYLLYATYVYVYVEQIHFAFLKATYIAHCDSLSSVRLYQHCYQ
jgi:hypothetical protein